MSNHEPNSGSIRGQMDRIYTEMSPADIPWNIQSPPKALVELVQSGQVLPCKAIDIGCGAGNYAIYLASEGFDVTAVDISESAIAIARENAKKRGVTCNVLVADALDGLQEFRGAFNFAYDWTVLHHIFPDMRKKYVETVHRSLAPGGTYMSVCFSEEDPAFGDSGKYRRTPIGTVLYFSSEEELRGLFEPCFNLRLLKTAEIEGKMGQNLMIVAFMEKK